MAECVIPSPNYPALLLPHPLPQLCSMFILILSDFSSQKSLHFKTNNIFGLTRVLSDSVKCQFHFLLDCLLKSTLTCFYFSFVGSGIAEQSYVGYVLCPMLNRWVSSSGAAGFLPLSSTASRGLPKRCQGISSIQMLRLHLRKSWNLSIRMSPLCKNFLTCFKYPPGNFLR